jgi:SAM-dependent methyltransferase
MNLFLALLEDVHVEEDGEMVRVISPIVVPSEYLQAAVAVAKEIASHLECDLGVVQELSKKRELESMRGKTAEPTTFKLSELAQRFPDVWGIKWAERPEEFRTNAETLAKQAGIETGDQVLDIGAGGGFLAPICRRIGADYLGTDIDFREYAVEVRRTNGASVAPFAMKAPDGDGDPFVVPAGWWDVIICGWIVFGEEWTLNQWKRAVESLFSILRSNGRLVLRFNEDRVEKLPEDLVAWLSIWAGRDGTFAREKGFGACGFVLTAPGAIG